MRKLVEQCQTRRDSLREERAKEKARVGAKKKRGNRVAHGGWLRGPDAGDGENRKRMLGDHAKSPFGVVPDALNGCTHPVGVIPRFLPFLLAPSSLSPTLEPIPPRGLSYLPSFDLSPSMSLFVPFSPLFPLSLLPRVSSHLTDASTSFFLPLVLHPRLSSPYLLTFFSFDAFLSLPYSLPRFFHSTSFSSPSTFTRLSISASVRVLLSARLTQQLFNHPRRTKVAETNGCPRISVAQCSYQDGACFDSTLRCPLAMHCSDRGLGHWDLG